MKQRADEDETGFPERTGINPTPDEHTGNPPTPHPAHTGIDPSSRNGQRRLQSRPRKRGDRPAEHTDPVEQ